MHERDAFEALPDLVVEGHRPHGDVAAGDALRDGHHVGHHVPVVDAEHRAGATEAAHDLVGDHGDVVSGADLADQRPVGVGRHQEARGAELRLGYEGGDVLGPLGFDHGLEEPRAARVARRILETERAAVTVVGRDLQVAGRFGTVAGLHGRDAGQVHGSVAGTVVAHVEADRPCASWAGRAPSSSAAQA